MTGLLAGCGGDSDSESPGLSEVTNTTAVVATVDSGFSTGEVELVEFGSTLSASGGYHSTQSDIDVASFDDDYYLIERFQADRIHKVDIGNPAIFQWQYSSLEQGETGSANPYDLIFVNAQKAYLLRYNKEKAWIVDPTAERQAQFKIGELDLSGYTPSDADIPRMSDGTIHNGKLYITLQRLASDFSPSNTSCVAVFDVSSNTELDTGQGSSACNNKGIPLNNRNPSEILYQNNVGLLVQNTGDYAPDYTISGIDKIDPSAYSVSTLVQANSGTGLITNIAVANENKGYFLGYDSFGSLDLRSFDPSSGNVDSGVVAGLSGVDLRDLAMGPDGRLWVGDARTGNPGLRLLDPGSDSELDFVGTDLLPKSITFTNIQ
jgi:hypothetical protein